MDNRLLEAAQTGNVDQLKRILEESPLLLHRVALDSSENPLHVASVAGHVDFVREVVKQKPDLAKELDQDGFSPLQLASANGYVEVVRELIKVDHTLCRIQGRDGITALHLAAMRGKIDVLSDITSTCAECVEDVTVQGESALHIAIKYNQFKAFKTIVERVKETNKECMVFNMKDEQENTIMHLATWRKQRKVLELLLKNGYLNPTLLKVNVINNSGLTALDILQIFLSEAGDREIGDILRSAGALRARDISFHCSAHSSEFCNHALQNQQRAPQTCPSGQTSLMEYFKFKKGRDSPSQARGALLVIAVLVATTTFQVGLSPPGGVWQDSNSGDNNSIPGKSIKGSKSAVWFAFFVVFNSIGFTMSLSIISILTSKFPLQRELQICIFAIQICIFAMYFTYNFAIVSMAPPGLTMRVFLIALASALPAILPLAANFARNIRKMAPEIMQRII